MCAPEPNGIFRIEPMPENLYREPIDFFYADHFRQRQVCNALDEIAAGPEGSADAARLILGFLKRDLKHHIADEEEDLFPRLRARCRSDDRLQDAIDLLMSEHAKEQDMALEILAGLERVAGGLRLEDAAAFAEVALRFTENERRHLFWENAYILPLARRRLTSDDLRAMGRSMAERRGARFPD